MENLSFVELKVKKKKEKLSNENFTKDSFSFIDSTKDIKTEAIDITNKMANGEYNFKTKYTIIFLYEYFKDEESRNFIKFYGGKLHNRSSANITILTYYSPDMGWDNVQYKEKLQYDRFQNNEKIEALIKNLRKVYNVEELPAIVVVKKGSKEYCSINLSNYKKDDMYDAFNDFIEIINDNCEEDFSRIINKLSGSASTTNTSINSYRFNTDEFIHDLIKEEDKEYQESQISRCRYTLDNLADEMNISVKTLYNKRTKNTFTRDECFYLIIRFNQSIFELKDLLIANNHQELGYKGRDGIIRECITNNYSIEYAEKMLKKKCYEGIIK